MNKKHRVVSFLLVIALAFTTIAAVAVVDDNTAITAEAASKIKLSSTKKSIGYKQSFNLSIKNTGSKTVKWSTSDKKIAKIKKVSKTKYKVTGVKPGTATITAKVSGKKYKCKVTVKKICHTTKNIAKGTSHTVALKGVSGTVKWSTSDKSVASIKKVSNKKYKVTGKKKGTATIKAKVGGKTYKCKVTVTNPKISKTSKSLNAGDSFNLSVSGGKGTITWSTSNSKVASIKKVSSTKYKVKAKKKGTATISAKVDGKTLKCKVKVKNDYSYALYLVSADKIYSGETYCFYLKTENPDIDYVYLKGTNVNSGGSFYRDAKPTKDYGNLVPDEWPVSGGYVFSAKPYDSGTNTMQLMIRVDGNYESVGTYKIKVLDFDTALNEWMDGLIKNYTDSGMSSFEKMESICNYLCSDEAGFKYPANMDDEMVPLTTQCGPAFETHVWDSYVSPAYLVKIAERIGGFDDIHNCYGDYTVGTSDWYSYHYKCRVTIGNDVRYYSVCPLSSTGEITSIKYIDFSSTKSLTKL